jgi:hypothetical protein
MSKPITGSNIGTAMRERYFVSIVDSDVENDGMVYDLHANA